MMINSISANRYAVGQMVTTRSSTGAGSAAQVTDTAQVKSEELFATFDADGNGSLSTAEVKSLTEMISGATGVSTDLSEFLATYDSDGDQSLSEKETMAALEANRPQGPPPGPPPGGRMERPDETDMVSDADANQDGVISEEEAEGLVAIINQATGSSLTAADFLTQYDEDGNGLSVDEAVAGMEANRPQEPSGAPMGGMGRMGDSGPDFAQLFTEADANGDDSLNVDEVSGLADMLGTATGTTMAASDLIADYDTDGDEGLSLEELATVLEANRPAGPPPPPDSGTGTGEATDPVTAAAIDQYLKVAAMGSDQQTADSLFSLLDNETTSLNSRA
jgi:Ca2+-binding EF-hand superfamily protein